MIDLSVVVVTWNTRELVLDCLASLEREALAGASGLEIETLVVDNGSRDGTPHALRACFPWARLLALPRNVGFAAGCNAGLAQTTGRHVLLLNSDARVLPGALAHCVRFLDRNPDVGIAGPQLVNPDGSLQNSIHNYPRVLTEILPKSLLQFAFRRRFPSRRWTGEAPIDVEAVVGAALFARRRTVESVGPLPEEYFFFLEETDWCWRARQAGWRVVFLPTARIAHLSGGSSKRKHPALTRIEYHRSLYRFFRRYGGVNSVALVFGVRFAKALFYVLSQAPMALAGARHRRRWLAHWRVLSWHLRGCPLAVGLGQLAAAAPRAPAGRRPVATPDAGRERHPAPDARA